MKPNVLKFKNDIKAHVAQKKETGYAGTWMHPMYCAYYILKHNVEDIYYFIAKDIRNSYKALQGDRKYYFEKRVKKILEEYAETVCVNR